MLPPCRAPSSTRLDAVAVAAAAFPYLQEKCQQNASDISNSARRERFEAAAEHNFHLRVILMMLSDCAESENENETKTQPRHPTQARPQMRVRVSQFLHLPPKVLVNRFFYSLCTACSGFMMKEKDSERE